METSDPVKKSVAAPGSHGSAGGSSVAPSGSTTHPDEPTRIASGDGRLAREALPFPAVEGYELHEEIHRGGQGVVYRATQLGTKRTVALKVLLEGPFASETSRRRFEREVELAASLRHPNIVTILESGISHDRYFFAMNFIEGRRLDQYLRETRPDLRTTLQLVLRVADAVNFAHQRGVIHRDLKPSNVLVDADGDPFVLDFGLAKSARADVRDSTLAVLSTTGQMIGTIAYMSPEQAQGSPDVDVRSDVYALGVMLYGALLERPPYEVEGPLGQVLHNIVHDDPYPPRIARATCRFGRQIDDELETILLKALEKEPERRFQTVGQFAADLRHYLAGEPIEAKRASGLYLLRKTLRRYRIQAAAAAIILLLTVAFAITTAWQNRQERHLRTLASNAEGRERAARTAAEKNAADALRAAAERQRALVQQKLQRGDLAQERGDLAEARDSYWDAYLDDPGSVAAEWALRQYYLRSGDLGAQTVFYRLFGPLALSPDATLLAACDAPGGITLRRVSDNAVLAWFPVPAAVVALCAANDGRVAAAGVGWVRVWSPASPTPTVAVSTTEWARPQAVLLARESLFVFSEPNVFRVDASGQVQIAAEFDGGLAAAPTLSADEQLLCAPTHGRVLLWSIAGGALRALPPFTAPGAVRDAALLGSSRLGILADGVYVADIAAGGRPSMQRRLPLREGWDQISAADDGTSFVLGSQDGRVGLLRESGLHQTWRVTQGSLLRTAWDSQAQALLTIDAQGSLTRWSPEGRTRFERALGQREVVHWTPSTNGRVLLMSYADGTVAWYAPGEPEPLVPFPLSGIAAILAGQNPTDFSLALTDDGRIGVVRFANQVWIRELSRPRPRPIRWTRSDAPQLKDVAISGDGTWLAYFARNQVGDQQVVHLQPMTPEFLDLTASQWRRMAAGGTSIEFTGSAVRAVRFIPGTGDLLVIRSNGQLMRIPALNGRETPDLLRSYASVAWIELDSPANQVVFDHTGRSAALLCDDGLIRIVRLSDGRVSAHMLVNRDVVSLAFDGSDGLLLARSRDGTLHVFEVESGQRIQTRTLPADDARPLVAWLCDSILASAKDHVLSIRQDLPDDWLERQRGFARARRLGRHLASGDFAAAWSEAEQIARADPAAGPAVQSAVLDPVLRRPRSEAPSEWLDALAGGRGAALRLRLAHAAYDGGRFDIARLLLGQAASEGDQRLDAYSLWRLAACDYLSGAPLAAAERLGEVLARRDLDPRHVPTVRLERVAALVAADRRSDAKALVDSMSGASMDLRDRNAAAALASAAIGHYLLGEQGESQLLALFRRLLDVFGESWLPYSDDLEFFAGELAYRKGDMQAARARYQRCIDTATDTWPADWARFRLRSLSGKP